VVVVIEGWCCHGMRMLEVRSLVKSPLAKAATEMWLGEISLAVCIQELTTENGSQP